MLPHQPIIGMTQSLHPARVEAQVAGLESRMSILGCTAGLGSGPHPYPSHILSLQSGLNFRKNNQPGRAV